MVYADQLQARGDPRGEYIAVELSLAAAARGSEERAVLARRRAELRLAHAADWWPELPERRIGTRRGFVETVAAFGSEVGRLAPLAAREPLAALELLDGDAPPADAPWQDRIRRLVVHTGYSGELLRLLGGALGRAAEELALATTSSQLPPLGGCLPRCRRLSLAGMNLADILQERWLVYSPLRTLDEWEHLARLEALDLSHCRVGGSAVGSLVSLQLPALRELRLSGNPLGLIGAAPLGAWLATLPALERVELVDTELGAAGGAILRQSETRARLVIDAPPPSQLAIDALGVELELTRVGESAWAISFDGARKPIRLRRPGIQRQPADTVVEHAALGRVVRALWTGAPRRLSPDGVALAIGGPGHGATRLVVASDHSQVRFESWDPL